MSDPLDQTTLAPMERPSTETLNRAQTTSRRALTFWWEQALAQRADIAGGRAKLNTGFVGEAFKVRPASPAGLEVELAAGMGFYFDPTQPLVIAQDLVVGAYQGVSDLAPHRPLVIADNITFPIFPQSGPDLWRYDIIEVRPQRELKDYETKLRYSVPARAFQPQSAAEALRYNIAQGDIDLVVSPAPSTAPLSLKRGTASTSAGGVLPTEPPVTPGYVKVARVLVSDTDSIVVDKMITDLRTAASMIEVSGIFSMPMTGTPTPVLTALNAPPGVDVAVLGSAAHGYSAEVLVFTGAQPTQVDFQISPLAANGGGASPVVLNAWALVTNGVVDATTTTVPTQVSQADLANATKTSPAGARAIGQPFVGLEITASRYNPAAGMGVGLFEASFVGTMTCSFLLRIGF